MNRNCDNGDGVTSGRALAPVRGSSPKAIGASPASRRLVPAVVPPEGIVVRDGGVTLFAGRAYDAHGLVVPAAEVFYDEEARPSADGPWLGEADKIAWRDPATGYDCIVLRDLRGGFLSGYVGVPSTHPLHGFDPDAVPLDLGIEVHGGLTYGRLCEEGPTPERRVRYEARRICHVPVGVTPTRHGSDYRVADAHAWWLGFSCDHLADVVPGRAAHAEHAASLGVAQIYRDDAYVCREVTDLAAQLLAVAEGRAPPPRSGPPLPPAAIDPRRRS